MDVIEKIVERAPLPQKPLAEKILELYRAEKPFDPDLNIERQALATLGNTTIYRRG